MTRISGFSRLQVYRSQRLHLSFSVKRTHSSSPKSKHKPKSLWTIQSPLKKDEHELEKSRKPSISYYAFTGTPADNLKKAYIVVPTSTRMPLMNGRFLSVTDIATSVTCEIQTEYRARKRAIKGNVGDKFVVPVMEEKIEITEVEVEVEVDGKEVMEPTLEDPPFGPLLDPERLQKIQIDTSKPTVKKKIIKRKVTLVPKMKAVSKQTEQEDGTGVDESAATVVELVPETKEVVTDSTMLASRANAERVGQELHDAFALKEEQFPKLEPRNYTDRWAQRFLETAWKLDRLLKTGEAREVPLFGLLPWDEVLMGKIDYMRLSDSGYVLSLYELKTVRNTPSTSGYFSRQASLQIALYKHMVLSLLQGTILEKETWSFKWKSLMARIGLDPNQTLSEPFKESLRQWESISSATFTPFPTFTTLEDTQTILKTVLRNLTPIPEVKTAIHVWKRNKLSKSRDANGKPHLVLDVDVGEEELEKTVYETLDFFMAQRVARGVLESDNSKCKSCEFWESCDWKHKAKLKPKSPRSTKGTTQEGQTSGASTVVKDCTSPEASESEVDVLAHTPEDPNDHKAAIQQNPSQFIDEDTLSVSREGKKVYYRIKGYRYNLEQHPYFKQPSLNAGTHSLIFDNKPIDILALHRLTKSMQKRLEKVSTKLHQRIELGVDERLISRSQREVMKAFNAAQELANKIDWYSVNRWPLDIIRNSHL